MGIDAGLGGGLVYVHFDLFEETGLAVHVEVRAFVGEVPHEGPQQK